MKTDDEIRDTVRAHYARVAGAEPGARDRPGCCGPSSATDMSLRVGYSAEEIAAVPEGANLGLGCGNPHGIAALREGETVLDLGSGAGFDALLAAREVGPTGRVIGVDMTPEMIAKARANAAALGASTVEFRLGDLEHLPVADATVDAVLSNCVINLVPDKRQVYREILRVLRPGGRVAIADVVALEPVPEALRSAATLCGCVAGAATVADLEEILAELGFADARITVQPESRDVLRDWFPGTGAERYVVSARIEARRPEAGGEPRALGGTARAEASCCAPTCCGAERG